MRSEERASQQRNKIPQNQKARRGGAPGRRERPRQHRPKKRRQEENRRVNQRWRARGARYGVPMGTMYRCMSMLPWAASLRPVFQASGRLFLRRGWRHSWLRARLVCFVQPRPTWLRWRPRRLSPLNALIPQLFREAPATCVECVCVSASHARLVGACGCVSGREGPETKRRWNAVALAARI